MFFFFFSKKSRPLHCCRFAAFTYYLMNLLAVFVVPFGPLMLNSIVARDIIPTLLLNIPPIK